MGKNGKLQSCSGCFASLNVESGLIQHKRKFVPIMPATNK